MPIIVPTYEVNQADASACSRGSMYLYFAFFIVQFLFACYTVWSLFTTEAFNEALWAWGSVTYLRRTMEIVGYVTMMELYVFVCIQKGDTISDGVNLFKKKVDSGLFHLYAQVAALFIPTLCRFYQAFLHPWSTPDHVITADLVQLMSGNALTWFEPYSIILIDVQADYLTMVALHLVMTRLLKTNTTNEVRDELLLWMWTEFPAMAAANVFCLLSPLPLPVVILLSLVSIVEASWHHTFKSNCKGTQIPRHSGGTRAHSTVTSRHLLFAYVIIMNVKDLGALGPWRDLLQSGMADDVSQRAAGNTEHSNWGRHISGVSESSEQLSKTFVYKHCRPAIRQGLGAGGSYVVMNPDSTTCTVNPSLLGWTFELGFQDPLVWTNGLMQIKSEQWVFRDRAFARRKGGPENGHMCLLLRIIPLEVLQEIQNATMFRKGFPHFIFNVLRMAYPPCANIPVNDFRYWSKIYRNLFDGDRNVGYDQYQETIMGDKRAKAACHRKIYGDPELKKARRVCTQDKDAEKFVPRHAQLRRSDEWRMRHAQQQHRNTINPVAEVDQKAVTSYTEGTHKLGKDLVVPEPPRCDEGVASSEDAYKNGMDCLKDIHVDMLGETDRLTEIFRFLWGQEDKSPAGLFWYYAVEQSDVWCFQRIWTCILIMRLLPCVFYTTCGDGYRGRKLPPAGKACTTLSEHFRIPKEEGGWLTIAFKLLQPVLLFDVCLCLGFVIQKTINDFMCDTLGFKEYDIVYSMMQLGFKGRLFDVAPSPYRIRDFLLTVAQVIIVTISNIFVMPCAVLAIILVSNKMKRDKLWINNMHCKFARLILEPLIGPAMQVAFIGGGNGRQKAMNVLKALVSTVAEVYAMWVFFPYHGEGKHENVDDGGSHHMLVFTWKIEKIPGPDTFWYVVLLVAISLVCTYIRVVIRCFALDICYKEDKLYICGQPAEKLDKVPELDKAAKSSDEDSDEGNDGDKAVASAPKKKKPKRKREKAQSAEATKPSSGSWVSININYIGAFERAIDWCDCPTKSTHGVVDWYGQLLCVVLRAGLMFVSAFGPIYCGFVIATIAVLIKTKAYEWFGDPSIDAMHARFFGNALSPTGSPAGPPTPVPPGFRPV